MIMTIRNSCLFHTIPAVIGLAFYLSGCGAVSLGSNLVENKTVKVELVDQDAGVSIHAAQLYEKNNTLAVYGTIKRSSDTRRKITEHVDIKVFSPDSTLLAEKTVRTRPLNPHANVRFTNFTAYLDTVPPEGSIVRIIAHRGTHP